jgi:hypothetical protein
MSDTPPAQPARKPPLKQTPQTVPGPGLGTPTPVKDKVTHHVLMKVRGTAESIIAKVKAHPTLPDAEKSYLATKIGAIKGEWITLDCHVFEQDGRLTVHAHVEAQSST